ncbi:MAG: alpha/beta fold hydrolase [Bacteroidota bacterium]
MKKWLIRIFALGFVLLNVSAAFHGYKFTHFASESEVKTSAESLSFGAKLGVLFLGVSNPRPVNLSQPLAPYEILTFSSGAETLEAWWITADSALGSVILFHGYSGEKSSMLKRAALLREIGYNTLLVDFRGSGGSTGNTTSIGFHESVDVRAAIETLLARGEENLYLLGTSMGAAAVLKAMAEDPAGVTGLILECPFGSLLQTAKNRFERMGVPAFPGAHLLVFWGGLENGFWGFGHQPSAYSQEVSLPTLLIHGQKDRRVKQHEIDAIFQALAGQKDLLLFPEAGHGNYLEMDQPAWIKGVKSHLLPERGK